VAARSKARNVFACSNTGIVSSKSYSRHACLSATILLALSYVGRDIATGLSPFQIALPTVYKHHNLRTNPEWKQDTEPEEVD
jgi:hypothetical protein